MNPTATCTTCGTPVPVSFARSHRVCPACLVSASGRLCQGLGESGEASMAAATTCWSDAFPQFEVGSVLVDDPDHWTCLALDLAGAMQPVVVQVVSGESLEQAGGVSAALGRANRLRELALPDVARILDAGDLADAFYLVTAREPGWVPLMGSILSSARSTLGGAELSAAMALTAEALAAAQLAGAAFRLDLRTTFRDEATGRIILTPAALPAFEGVGGSADRPTAATIAPALGAGSLLGPYRLDEHIGEGGFGEVWRAHQERPVARVVAVKLLKTAAATPRLLARFEVERQALARLDHPHIARFLDAGTAPDGRPFIAMEWVDGRTICRHCEHEKLTLDARLRLFRGVVEAVEHAHQKGILHRDLKPSNVLVPRVEAPSAASPRRRAPDGPGPAEVRVKVIDFGIARAFDDPMADATLLTRADELLGTPATMSPEQAAGRHGSELDVRTDVYGLGILLYQMLTGQLPHDPALPPDELRRRIREQDAPKPSVRAGNAATARHLRGELDWIVLKCLEKSPDRRYPGARALIDDIDRHLNDEPVLAGPPSPAYRLGKFARRHRHAFVSAAVILLALVAAAVVSTFAAFRAKDAEHRATSNFTSLQSAYSDLEKAESSATQARMRSRQLLVSSLLEKGASQFNAGEVIGLITLQEAVEAAEGDSQLLSKAMEFWTLASAWLPGSVEYVIDEPFAVDIAPLQPLLAWCDKNGLHVYNYAEAKKKSISVHPDLLRSETTNRFAHLGLVFSSTGSHLALHNSESGIARVWNCLTLEPATPLLRHPPKGSSPDLRMLRGWRKVAIDPEGRYLATISARGSACLWNIATGSLARQPWEYSTGVEYANIAISPSGQSLAFSSGDSLVLVDVSRQDFPERSIPVGQGTHELSFKSDAELLTMHFHRITLWDITTGEIKATLAPPWDRTFHLIEDVAFSSDRRQVSLACRNGEFPILSSETFQPLMPPLARGEVPRSVRFSADGAYVVTGAIDGSVCFWPAGDEKPVAVWTHAGVVDQVRTPAAGDFLISRSSEAVLRRLPGEHGVAIGKTLGDDQLMDATPDGKSFLVLSESRNSLSVVDATGTMLAQGPVCADGDETIVSARFLPGAGRFAYSTVSRASHRFRIWNAETGTDTGFLFTQPVRQKQTLESQIHKVATVLPKEPPLLPVLPRTWQFSLIDSASGDIVKSAGLSHHPSCVTVDADSGWFGVGDLSGVIRRFHLDSLEEMLPRIRVPAPVLSAACAKGREWMVTVEQEKNGAQSLRAWFVRDGPPFLSLKLPVPFIGGALFPLESGVFCFQQGTDIQTLSLPPVTAHPNQTDAATRAALAVRKDPAGEIISLTAEEFQTARKTE